MELLTAAIKLRRATPEDLVHWESGERITLSRQRFWVQTDQRLECYTLSQYSDKRTVLELMIDGRIWVPAGASLNLPTDGEVLSIEEVVDTVAA